jgi:hypothetical protein
LVTYQNYTRCTFRKIFKNLYSALVEILCQIFAKWIGCGISTDMARNYRWRPLNFQSLISIPGYSCPQGLDILCLWFVTKVDVYRWGWRCRGKIDTSSGQTVIRETLSSHSIFETEDPGAVYCLTGTECAILWAQKLSRRKITLRCATVLFHCLVGYSALYRVCVLSSLSVWGDVLV